ncbi:MAG: DNA-3-methyladenine glycosylase [Flavobacteriales bacterium]|nr:DNA-3-methyladenine glycosylase [Flavobacteriales bacterium]
MNTRLPRSFYTRPDVVLIAIELLGKVLVTGTGGATTAGIITETEAYAGITDRASHAHGGRRTVRNAPMYALGGTIYVYLCYGIHHLFNVVTNARDVPEAVLIRGILPVEGMGLMEQRRGRRPLRTDGPGTLTQALGIDTSLTGSDLFGALVRIEDRGIPVDPGSILVGPRIGIDYAGSDALLPYRFRIAPSWRPQEEHFNKRNG